METTLALERVLFELGTAGAPTDQRRLDCRCRDIELGVSAATTACAATLICRSAAPQAGAAGPGSSCPCASRRSRAGTCPSAAAARATITSPMHMARPRTTGSTRTVARLGECCAPRQGPERAEPRDVRREVASWAAWHLQGAHRRQVPVHWTPRSTCANRRRERRPRLHRARTVAHGAPGRAPPRNA